MGPRSRSSATDFNAAAASEDEVGQAIRHLVKHAGYVMDPHTACGYVALQKCRAPHQQNLGSEPKVILATAHPAKFPDAIAALLGSEPRIAAAVVGSNVGHGTV